MGLGGYKEMCSKVPLTNESSHLLKTLFCKPFVFWEAVRKSYEVHM